MAHSVWPPSRGPLGFVPLAWSPWSGRLAGPLARDLGPRPLPETWAQDLGPRPGHASASRFFGHVFGAALLLQRLLLQNHFAPPLCHRHWRSTFKPYPTRRRLAGTPLSFADDTAPRAGTGSALRRRMSLRSAHGPESASGGAGCQFATRPPLSCAGDTASRHGAGSAARAETALRPAQGPEGASGGAGCQFAMRPSLSCAGDTGSRHGAGSAARRECPSGPHRGRRALQFAPDVSSRRGRRPSW